jgi:hypothetical protein
MGCNCGKKKAPVVVTPEPIVIPQTPEQQHAQEMDKYAQALREETMDWFNNIDVIKTLDDEQI